MIRGRVIERPSARRKLRTPLREVDASITRGVRAAVQGLKDVTPVDTGELRDSTGVQKRGRVNEVGWGIVFNQPEGKMATVEARTGVVARFAQTMRDGTLRESRRVFRILTRDRRA